MKKLIIMFFRHGNTAEDCQLSPKGKERAEEFSSRLAKFDVVFSANNGRSVETAMILGKTTEKYVIADKVFDDLSEADKIIVRLAEIISFVITNTVTFAGAENVTALVVSSSNLVSAAKHFSEGKFPNSLERLDVIDHLGSFPITISFG